MRITIRTKTKQRGITREGLAMAFLKCLWAFLNGKKTSIATSACLILAYLSQQGVISNDLNVLIVAILTAFGISANVGNAVATKKAKQNV